MEAMALIAAQMAISDNPSIDMSVVCHKANIATKWIERQRVNTTVTQMQFFKGKRQILFKQWDSAYRGPARDHMGHFRSKRVANADADADTSETSSVVKPTQVGKRSKMDAYGDIFAQFHCSV